LLHGSRLNRCDQPVIEWWRWRETAGTSYGLT
jgi:hypothetical protein